MLVMWSGSPLMAANATAKRRMVPLPLFWLPSISNKQVVSAMVKFQIPFNDRLVSLIREKHFALIENDSGTP